MSRDETPARVKDVPCARITRNLYRDLRSREVPIPMAYHVNRRSVWIRLDAPDIDVLWWELRWLREQAMDPREAQMATKAINELARQGIRVPTLHELDAKSTQ